MKIIYATIIAIALVSCGEEQVGSTSTEGKVEEHNSADEVKKNVTELTDTSKNLSLESIVLDSVAGIVIDESGMVNSPEIANENGTNDLAPPLRLEETPVDPPVMEDIPEVIPEIKEIQEVVEVPAQVNHLAWDALVTKNVSSSGKVNYKGFKASSAALNSYLEELSKEAPGSGWTRNEKLAYWINAYNAFTVKLIVDNYPLKSITDIPKAWDTKNIKIAGKMYSLGGIENDILRKMNEPRIHFAINCASVSCPNLLNQAFKADKLSSQLSKVTKSFFADVTKNDFSGKTIKISKLFDWYGADFSNGDIIKYINSNRTEQLSDKTKISYLEYDWLLNE